MRMIDLGRTAYWWLPGLSTLADVTKPKMTEIASTADPDGAGPLTGTPGAINISKYVINSTEIMAVASDTVDERSVLATGNAKVPVVGNYQGQLNLFRDAKTTYTDSDTTVWSENDLGTLFKDKGIEGYIIKRTGLPAKVALAAQQQIEVYGFVTDVPMYSGGKQDGYLKIMVPLLPTGDFAVNAVLQT